MNRNFFGNLNPNGTVNMMGGLGGMNAFGPMPPYNGVNQPDLLLGDTGRLSPMWVNWYRSKTGATLPEAMKAGLSRMIEIQKQMVDFFSEYTLQPSELMAAYPDYVPNDPASYNSYFYQHAGRNGRDVPAIDPSPEPSPFGGPILNAGEEVGMRFQTAWELWYIKKTGASTETAQRRHEALCKKLEERVRITPENLNIGPLVSTDGKNVDLLWLVYVADMHPQASMTELQYMGENLLGTGNANLRNAYGPGPSAM